ncbi:MAG: hypothetical protein GX608_09645 [Lentisphaerae bacterium]|nr:hypothetical protein [Lentisphaerota bacterium]
MPDINLLPDPITHFQRLQKAEVVTRRMKIVGERKAGFNLRYWHRIVRVPGKLDRIGAARGWPPEKLLLMKALLTSRMGAYYVDHILQRLKQLDAMTLQEENQNWEKLYFSFIERYRNEERIHDREQILFEMAKIHRFVNPPSRLLENRARHWKLVERFLAPGFDLDAAMTAEIRHALESQAAPTAKAFKVCFAVGLFADVAERSRGVNWMMAYENGMLGLFDMISAQPAVMHAIMDM